MSDASSFINWPVNGAAAAPAASLDWRAQRRARMLELEAQRREPARAPMMVAASVLAAQSMNARPARPIAPTMPPRMRAQRVSRMHALEREAQFRATPPPLAVELFARPASENHEKLEHYPVKSEKARETAEKDYGRDDAQKAAREAKVQKMRAAASPEPVKPQGPAPLYVETANTNRNKPEKLIRQAKDTTMCSVAERAEDMLIEARRTWRDTKVQAMRAERLQAATAARPAAPVNNVNPAPAPASNVIYINNLI